MGTGTTTFNSANDVDVNLTSATAADAATDGFVIVATGTATSILIGSASLDTITGGTGADDLYGGGNLDSGQD